MTRPALECCCPACDAPRIDGDECPRCGVIYAKAEARRRAVESVPVEDVLVENAPVEDFAPPTPAAFGKDALFERRLRLVAAPLALALSALVVQVGMLRAIGRVFLSMWVHEVGHAATAWMVGFAAVPGPWRTFIGDERSSAVTLVLACVAGAMGWRAVRTRSRALGLVAIGLFLLHLVGRFGPGERAAHALVTFGGDAGMLLLGALLVASFPVAATNVLRRNALRWGLLVIGAFAFMDAGDTWWRAGFDPDVIPYGLIEGVGHSDPSVLVDEHGWTEEQLIARHRGAALAGLAVMATSYALGLRRPPRT